MNKEPPQTHTMKIVRSWLSGEGVFKYYRVYRDGAYKESSRKEADQYIRAYNTKVITITGEPTEGTWSSIGN